MVFVWLYRLFPDIGNDRPETSFGGGPPSQGWKTVLRNHADGFASVDFLTSTVMFELAEIGDKTQSLIIILAQVQKAASNNTWYLMRNDG